MQLIEKNFPELTGRTWRTTSEYIGNAAEKNAKKVADGKGGAYGK